MMMVQYRDGYHPYLSQFYDSDADDDDNNGYSINSLAMKGKKFPLVYGKDVSESCPEFSSQACNPACINSSLVKRKIVMCSKFEGYAEVNKVGAAGSILFNDQYDKVSFVVSLPVVAVSMDNFTSLISYKNSAKEPEAEILKTEAIKDFDAPVVTPFSSRGPNAILPDILKI